MLLKYPEMLWGLLLLIIPILIHLLRLRRYRKTAFTNVRLLQRLVVEANRSSEIKKWLLLICRLGLVGALVLAFAQPFFAREDAGEEREITLYIDNSFSMQAPEERASLLQNAVQDLLQQLPADFECALLTNTEQFSRRSLGSLRESLLGLSFTYQQVDATSILLQARDLFSRDENPIRELWMISDFQDPGLAISDTTGMPRIHVLPVRPENRYNLSVDTAFVRSRSAEIVELEVGVSLDDTTRNKPLSLFNGDTLLAKSAPEIGEDGRATAVFSLPVEQSVQGSIRVLDEGLEYDNNLYFNLDRPPKIRVFSLGPGPWDYLRRIYTEDEFEFQWSRMQEADYAVLESQHLIILNEVADIPQPLARLLVTFVREGGNLLVIPAEELSPANYNVLLRPLGMGIQSRESNRNLITDISFGHPLYQDVFEGEITNFEYPSVGSYYTLLEAGAPVLGFQNGAPFLSANASCYLFTAALNPGNSNFRQSPLIVPTLYAIGKSSLPYPDLYYTIGTPSEMELDQRLDEDRIFTLRGPDYEFIPRQQAFARKTRLLFGDEPRVDGNFTVFQDDNPGPMVSFNYPRTESQGLYPPPEFPDFVTVHEDSEALVARYQNDTRITALWKWFVILALLFVLAEAILQKTIR
ncbi:BatA domain-containing protein [Robiginitalea sp. SC105]|uniref:BatA domain-containing protein n=1 Tax=Robiginitalea sp. SC105 TaxID=2762332 RepID=UPI00163ADA73|nr:BatA domain-containing protein [Robiginitalea sp. SC105]MBC2840656.1 BatA domain-containing protein [Robiginitalea sp. SC105]